MNTFTVYYNLRSEGIPYQDFFAELEHIEDLVHVSKNQFMLSSLRSSESIYQGLVKFLGPNDSLLVTKVTGPWAGKVAPNKERWLQENLV